MARHLAVQGASDDDVARLRELLNQVGARLGSAWLLQADADADMLVIDIDTVYGHMDWLRVHSTGRPVAVLTEHTQFEDADLILHKPLELANLIDVLERAGARVPPRPDIAPAPAAPAPSSVTQAKPEPKAAPAPVAPPPEVVEAAPPPPSPARERRLAEWLNQGALPAPARLSIAGSPDLTLDPASRIYFSDGTLRALAPYCARTITREDWQPIHSSEIAELQAAGKGQPFSRLLWLCHALGSGGQLAAGLDMNARYKLARWPQIEREFPKHFRIATVMMKQSASLTEIADQSGATLVDVIDFTNAYNATGHIETDGGATAGAPATRDSGRHAILQRLRNPFGNTSS
jgi:hypothetical protein